MLFAVLCCCLLLSSATTFFEIGVHTTWADPKGLGLEWGVSTPISCSRLGELGMGRYWEEG
jgi:hypothetical protein